MDVKSWELRAAENSFVQATEIHYLGSDKMWSSLAIPETGPTGKGVFLLGEWQFPMGNDPIREGSVKKSGIFSILPQTGLNKMSFNNFFTQNSLSLDVCPFMVFIKLSLQEQQQVSYIYCQQGSFNSLPWVSYNLNSDTVYYYRLISLVPVVHVIIFCM